MRGAHAPAFGSAWRVAPAGALAAGLVIGAPAAGQPGMDPVGVFRSACLDTLPHFAGAARAFAAARLDETPASAPSPGQPPIRRFGRVPDGDGAVQIGVSMPRGRISTCVVSAPEPSATPDGPAFFELDRAIGARADAAPIERCEGTAAARRCSWIWERPGGCNAVIATASSGLLRGIFATGIDTERDCAEAAR